MPMVGDYILYDDMGNLYVARLNNIITTNMVNVADIFSTDENVLLTDSFDISIDRIILNLGTQCPTRNKIKEDYPEYFI